MGNSLLFVAIGTPLVALLSLCAAILVHSRWLSWRPVWRVALFAPYVTTLVATAVVWRYLLPTRYGLAHYLLSLADRKRVVLGKSESVRVHLCGRRTLKTQKKN